MIEVRSFYRFSPLTNNRQRADRLNECCNGGELLGTILLAREGINGTLSGAPPALDRLFSLLADDPEIGELKYRRSFANATEAPFATLKIRQKDWVLTFPKASADASPTYVEPEDWDALIAREGVQLVDARNGYETCIGTFDGAHTLPIENFHEWPKAMQKAGDFDHKPPVALYCTGGIRCEKASAWLRDHGFNEVYQLSGGILNYLHRISTADSSWQGDCFVFDQRIAVNQNLAPAAYTLCQGCQRPVRQGDSSGCNTGQTLSSSCTCERAVG